MNETTLKEYSQLHNIPQNTLMVHMERLCIEPTGKTQRSPKGRESFTWKVSDMDSARAKVKRRMVQL